MNVWRAEARNIFHLSSERGEIRLVHDQIDVTLIAPGYERLAKVTLQTRRVTNGEIYARSYIHFERAVNSKWSAGNASTTGSSWDVEWILSRLEGHIRSITTKTSSIRENIPKIHVFTTRNVIGSVPIWLGAG